MVLLPVSGSLTCLLMVRSNTADNLRHDILTVNNTVLETK